ncbi:MAG: hypothetical protein M3Q16_04515, partial [Pseudomonadota bacterium]|nr:hypothetical protein [Pseudomonadota bacterium]
FYSLGAFDRHRTGSFNDGTRRCLTVVEMRERNFGKSKDGYWLAPIAKKDRERLLSLRAGKNIKDENDD